MTPKRKPKQPKQPQKDKGKEEQVIKGFDGKKLQLPAQPSSSSAPPSNQQQDEVKKLKEVLQAMVGGVQLTGDQLEMLKTDPYDEVRIHQKELNLRRRKLNRHRNLQQKIETTDKQFEDWMNMQKQVVRQEKARYQAERDRLVKELENLKNNEETQEAEMPEDFEFEDDEPMDKDKDAAMARRLEQAEQQAYHAQQAFLQMQSQMQQMMAYQAQFHQALQSQASTETPVAAPAEPVAGSPQLPKPVHKEHLKPPTVRKTSSRKPASNKQVEKENAIIELDDEEPEAGSDEI